MFLLLYCSSLLRRCETEFEQSLRGWCYSWYSSLAVGDFVQVLHRLVYTDTSEWHIVACVYREVSPQELLRPYETEYVSIFETVHASNVLRDGLCIIQSVVCKEVSSLVLPNIGTSFLHGLHAETVTLAFVLELQNTCLCPLLRNY